MSLIPYDNDDFDFPDHLFSSSLGHMERNDPLSMSNFFRHSDDKHYRYHRRRYYGDSHSDDYGMFDRRSWNHRLCFPFLGLCFFEDFDGNWNWSFSWERFAVSLLFLVVALLCWRH